MVTFKYSHDKKSRFDINYNLNVIMLHPACNMFQRKNAVFVMLNIIEWKCINFYSKLKPRLGTLTETNMKILDK